MSMLEVLKFVQGAVAKKDFVPVLQHFKIAGGYIKGYNGLISLCSPIAIDLSISPLALPFVKAIQTCTETISLHVTDKGRLSIKSGGFKAFVDCTTEEFPDVNPEGVRIPLGGEFLKAIEVLEPFIAEDASRPWARGILFRGQSAYATNNVILVERWLGYNFPVQVNIPRMAIAELLRIGEDPEAIQITDNNVTFHFKNNRWLRTQTYSLDWPDVIRILDKPSNPVPVSDGFFAKVATLLPFVGEASAIYFNDREAATHQAQGTGASIEVFETDTRGIYNINQLLRLENVSTHIDFSQHPNPCYFFGDRIRGALLGMRPA